MQESEWKNKMKQDFYGNLFSKDTYYNSVLLTKQKYYSIIEDIKRIKTLKQRELTRDYRLVERYDVLTIKGREKLITPKSDKNKNVKIYVHADELFEILYSTHISTGHGGRDKMIQELHKRYSNITRAQLKMFLDSCESCLCKSDKRGTAKNKSINTVSNFNNKCQVDFIDFQSQADEEFKFILVYQDVSTKFVVLKPISSKRATEVTHNLLDIFLSLGAPCILNLDSGNGNKFCNNMMELLRKMWPELKIVQVKLKPSESNEKSENHCENYDIINMLTTWMTDNKTNKWSRGLKFVQYMKNCALSSKTKKRPYEDVFGGPAKVGLASTILPRDMLCSINDKIDCEPSQDSNSKLPEIKNERSSSVDSQLQQDEDSIIDEDNLFLSQLRANIMSDFEVPSNPNFTTPQIQKDIAEQPEAATCAKQPRTSIED